MSKKASLIVMFILLALVILMIGFIATKLFDNLDLYIINFLQIAFLTAFVVPVILIAVDDETESIEEHFHRDPHADLKVVQDMAKQMLKTMNERIQESCTVMGFKETEFTYEIELLINEGDFLKSYQEVAIIPFEKVHELEYWQEITRIIIRNNQLRKNPQQNPQQKSNSMIQRISQNSQTRKRSRTIPK